MEIRILRWRSMSKQVNELHGTGDPRVSTIMASHRKWIDSNFIVGESNRAADLVELFNSKRGKQ